MGANVQNVTGHYSAVNWYRCVSHCGAAKELLLCLFVYQLLSQQSRCVSRRNKYFNQTCPGDKPEKQGVVRNQLVVPRWSDGSETTKKTNPLALPSPNLPFW